MSKYNESVLTTAGLELATRAFRGQAKFTITRTATTADTLTEAEIKGLAKLPNEKQTGTLTSSLDTPDGDERIAGTKVLYTNEKVIKGYNITAIGLYTKEDGKDTEFLYAVTLAAEPEYMPDFGDKVLFEFGMSIFVVVGQKQNVTIQLNPQSLATIEYVDKAIADHQVVFPADLAYLDKDQTVTGKWKFGQNPVDKNGDEYVSRKTSQADADKADAVNLGKSEKYTDDKITTTQFGGTNLLKNGKFDQGMTSWRSWGTSPGGTVDFRTGDKDWDGRATTLIHIKKPNAEGQFGVAQDGVLVAPHTQYTLSAVRTGLGPIYLQNGNGSTDPYQETITPVASIGAVATHTFTTGDTRSTNAYVGFGEGDTGELFVSLVKLEKGATHSDFTPYVPADVDDSATVGRVLADTDDVHKLAAGGIYQFNGKVPVNGPTLADPNGHNWGFFQLVDRGAMIKVLHFWDIFGHHRISIYSGSPGGWSSWNIPNDASFVHMTGNEAIDGTKAFKQPVSALVTGLYATQLADGADCNTLTHEGLYQATSGAIVNGPDGIYKWSMIRVHNLNSSNGYQVLFATNTGQTCTRAWNYNNGTINWTEWQETAGKSEFDPSLFAGRILTADDDLLTLGPGMYSTNGQTPKNMPTKDFTPGWSWIRVSPLPGANAKLIDIKDVDHHHLVRTYAGAVPVWSDWTVPNVSEVVHDNHDGSVKINGVSYVPADKANVSHRNPNTGVISEKSDFTQLTVNGGKTVATSDDLKSLESSSWKLLVNNDKYSVFYRLANGMLSMTGWGHIGGNNGNTSEILVYQVAELPTELKSKTWTVKSKSVMGLNGGYNWTVNAYLEGGFFKLSSFCNTGWTTDGLIAFNMTLN